MATTPTTDAEVIAWGKSFAPDETDLNVLHALYSDAQDAEDAEDDE